MIVSNKERAQGAARGRAHRCIVLERCVRAGRGQVLSYFGEFQPVFVEWLDDSSCNVLFGDAFTAKRAIFSLGKPLPPEDVPVGQGAPPALRSSRDHLLPPQARLLSFPLSALDAGI